MDDDYMSDDFLVAAEAVKNPGLTTSTSGKRQLKLERFRAENEERYSKKPKRDEIEKERREEALATPVAETTKGFALLAKMGYKPGMSLGKKKDENDMGSGIKVPLNLEVRTGRIGLGHDIDLLEQRRQAATRIKAEFAKMKDDAKRHDEILEEFRKRKRDTTVCRKLIADIQSCRKACMDLDVRKGLRRPIQSWFWKSFLPKEDEPGPSNLEETEDAGWVYANGEPAEKEDNFEEFTDEYLREKLIAIVEYLRSEHLYCVWCGHVYQSTDELRDECSGPLREDHDDDY